MAREPAERHIGTARGDSRPFSSHGPPPPRSFTAAMRLDPSRLPPGGPSHPPVDSHLAAHHQRDRVSRLEHAAQRREAAELRHRHRLLWRGGRTTQWIVPYSYPVSDPPPRPLLRTHPPRSLAPSPIGPISLPSRPMLVPGYHRSTCLGHGTLDSAPPANCTSALRLKPRPRYTLLPPLLVPTPVAPCPSPVPAFHSSASVRSARSPLAHHSLP